MEPARPPHRPPAAVPIAADAAKPAAYDPYRDPQKWLLLGGIVLVGGVMILLVVICPGFVLGLALSLLWLLVAAGLLASSLALLGALFGKTSDGSAPPPTPSAPSAEELARRENAAFDNFLAGLLLGWWLGGPPDDHDC